MRCCLSTIMSIILMVAVGASGQTSASEEIDGLSSKSPSIRTLPSLLPLITEEAIAGAVVHPRPFFDSEAVRQLPIEIVAADMESHLGVDLRRIEFVVCFLERAPTQPLSVGWIVQFADDFDWRRLPERLLSQTVFGTLDGRPYRKGKGALDPSLLYLDERTLIVAPDQTLRRMLAKRETMPSDASISQQLSQGIGKSLDAHIVLNAASIRSIMLLQLDEIGRGRGEVVPSLVGLLGEAERLEIRARLSRQLAVGAVLDTASKDAAARARDLLLACVAEIDTRWNTPTLQASTMLDAGPNVLQPSDARAGRLRIDQLARYLQRSICHRLSAETIRASGTRVQWGFRGDATTQTAVCAALSMLLLPATESISPAVDQWQSMDGMQRLSEAMIAYAQQHSRFPARASFSDQREPLLSWRVHILPFLGHRDLFNQFKLDEAWDGPHNRTLIRQMPAIYQNPRRVCDFRTTYIVPVGAGTMFEDAEGVLQSELRGGPGNTLMLVEADEDRAVYWTQPEDLRYDARDPWHGLGSLRESGFLGARADGTVQFFYRTMDQLRLRAYFSHDDQMQLH